MIECCFGVEFQSIWCSTRNSHDLWKNRSNRFTYTSLFVFAYSNYRSRHIKLYRPDYIKIRRDIYAFLLHVWMKKLFKFLIMNPEFATADLFITSKKHDSCYEAAVLCDEYNQILFYLLCCISNRFKLFNVYSKEYNNCRYHSVDDHLQLLIDYEIMPEFISKDAAVQNFMKIVTQRNDASNLIAANYMKWIFTCC